jgi:23S rRNA G2445 N2-methylase RlmL
VLDRDDPEAIPFHFDGALNRLQQLRTISAIYLGSYYPIPRPKALLGDQNFKLLLKQINQVLQLHPPQTFHSFHFSAAGKDSTVFQRLREEISRSTSLSYAESEGDLLLRVRPAEGPKRGWEVLVRLTPRPLSARPWRVYNLEGALNGTIAAAMVQLTQPKAKDRFINLMCGSGTLLVERLLLDKSAMVVGCDIDPVALKGTRQNLLAAGVDHSAWLSHQDVNQLAFASRSFEVIVADLPWGQLVGSHEQNKALYPWLLSEAARIATPGARLALITHEARLLEQMIKEQGLWQVHQVIKLKRGDLRPRIYLLQR